MNELLANWQIKGSAPSAMQLAHAKTAILGARAASQLLKRPLPPANASTETKSTPRKGKMSLVVAQGRDDEVEVV
eukprot:4738629-Amphidinium_carterae.1